MIQLSSKSLSPATLSHLARIQQRIDSQSDFLKKIGKAKAEWKSKSTSTAKESAFNEIKDTLLTMCVGVEICNYCENNEATDIEHIYPKSLFPERAFRWENYLLACKTCNTHYKLDKFAVFDPPLSEVPTEIPRDYGQPATDDAAMIDPRLDDPLQYFWLDILAPTYFFKPRLDLDSRSQKRAEYTLEILGLNSRSALVASRKCAFNYFFDRLERYVKVKEAVDIDSLLEVVPEPHLIDTTVPFIIEQARIKDALYQDITQFGHPTVWQEMKRQRNQLTKTNGFFDRAPEAMGW